MEAFALLRARGGAKVPARDAPARAPTQVVQHLLRELPPDATVADVGSGTGIFATEFARQLPSGKVYAMEV